MSARGPYRRHIPECKLQLCTDIQDGKPGRREDHKTYQISTILIQLWLAQHDCGEFGNGMIAAITMAKYEAQIAAFVRKVGQLMIELDFIKKGCT